MPEAATTTSSSTSAESDHQAPASGQQRPLKRTPLYAIHSALGAKIVPFAGFEMPVQYPTGITAEHKAVREKAGLFDVSHMGEFMVRGPQAVDFVNYVTTNDVAALKPGEAHYSTILREDGTIVDDCLIYRSDDCIIMVVNGSNVDKDFAHISRTGYTGEDGFELYVDVGDAEKLWKALTASGEVTPAGLGARDSLRLEMGMALYGNDLDDTTTPLEATLGWLVKMKKGDFVGRDALQKQKDKGLARKLVGFTTPERSFPRHGYPVFVNGKPSGEVRSGTMSPTLGIPIGTAYVPPEAAVEGSALEIEIRGKRVPAVVQKMPFYKNGSRL